MPKLSPSLLTEQRKPALPDSFCTWRTWSPCPRLHQPGILHHRSSLAFLFLGTCWSVKKVETEGTTDFDGIYGKMYG